MTASLERSGPTLTPELRDRLLSGARAGLHKETVATACGISPDLLDVWLREGMTRDAIEPYRTFALHYAAAEHVIEVEVSAAIVDAARRDARVGLQYLAARYPKKWGKDATPQAAIDLRPNDGGADEQMAESILGTPEFAQWAARNGFSITRNEP